MFIGHYAPALAAATVPRAPRLWVLFLAAQLVDVAACLLVFAGVDHAVTVPSAIMLSPVVLFETPWTGGLFATLGWAAGFAVALRLAGGSKDAAWLGAAVVASPWVFDRLIQAPDLTLAAGAGRLGAELLNHPYVAMPLELMLAFVALAFYAERVPARDWRGRATLALLVAAMLGFQVAGWLGVAPLAAIDPTSRNAPLAPLAVYTILTVFAGWTGGTRGRAHEIA